MKYLVLFPHSQFQYQFPNIASDICTYEQGNVGKAMATPYWFSPNAEEI
jgi:hypothetical protein